MARRWWARPIRGPITAQVRSLLRPAVAVTFAMTILGYAGVFTTFTYLAPLVRDLAFHRTSTAKIILDLVQGDERAGSVARRLPLTDRLARRQLLALLAQLEVG